MVLNLKTTLNVMCESGRDRDTPRAAAKAAAKAATLSQAGTAGP